MRCHYGAEQPHQPEYNTFNDAHHMQQIVLSSERYSSAKESASPEGAIRFARLYAARSNEYWVLGGITSINAR